MKELNKAKKAIEQGKLVEIIFKAKQLSIIILPSKKHMIKTNDDLLRYPQYIFIPWLKNKIFVAKQGTWKKRFQTSFASPDDDQIVLINDIAKNPSVLARVAPECLELGSKQVYMDNGKTRITMQTITIKSNALHVIEEKIKPDQRYILEPYQLQALRTTILNYPMDDQTRKFLKEFDKLTQEEQNTLLIHLAYMFLTSKETYHKVKRDVLDLLENDRKNREVARGSEILLTCMRDGRKLGRMSYKIVDRSDFKIHDLQALFDIVLRITALEKTEYIAIVKTNKIGEMVQKRFNKKVSIITAKKISEITGLDSQTAWKLKESIEQMPNKKLIAELDNPINLDEDVKLTGLAITPLIEHERSPFIFNIGKRKVKVRVCKLDKLLISGSKSFVPMLPNTFTRIINNKNIPKRSKPFVADVLLYLFNHRHNDIASLNIHEFGTAFGTRDSKQRRTSALRRKVEKALEWLIEAGIVVDYRCKRNKCEVELRFS